MSEIKNGRLGLMAKCNNLRSWALKGLTVTDPGIDASEAPEGGYERLGAVPPAWVQEQRPHRGSWVKIPLKLKHKNALDASRKAFW